MWSQFGGIHSLSCTKVECPLTEQCMQQNSSIQAAKARPARATQRFQQEAASNQIVKRLPDSKSNGSVQECAHAVFFSQLSGVMSLNPSLLPTKIFHTWHRKCKNPAVWSYLQLLVQAALLCSPCLNPAPVLQSHTSTHPSPLPWTAALCSVQFPAKLWKNSQQRCASLLACAATRLPAAADLCLPAPLSTWQVCLRAEAQVQGRLTSPVICAAF